MPESNSLVNLSGQPLISESKLIVIKQPRNSAAIPHQLIDAIAKSTGCSVIILPMHCELLSGNLAAADMASIHNSIHAISDLPNINFTKAELSLFYAAIRYLCEKTQPGDKSPEVTLLHRTKPHVV